MLRKLAVAACMLLVAACSTTSVQKADLGVAKPPAGARILIIQPDVQLATLTMAGLLEPRADWSQEGRDNITTEVTAAVKGHAHAYQLLDPSTALAGRTGQLLRLNEAVLTSITAGYGAMLPTKKGSFDWTLGEGAQALGQAYGADYALFTYGKGSYSSGGRKAAWLVMAAAGVSIPLGGQQAYASLVDLKTGRVVWFNTTVASPTADMRSASGAKELATSLLKDVPL